MYQLVLLIHVFIAVFIVALVLVQQGKGATMGAAFGAGASQTIFGSRGSGSFLFRLTVGLAITFFATSIFLNYMAMNAYKQTSQGQLPLQNLQQSLPISKTPNIPAPVETVTKNIPTNNNDTGAVKSAPVKNGQSEKVGTSLPSKNPVKQ